MKLKLAGIVKESIVDGPGIRFVIFVQGCPHRCAGCHNPNTHDPSAGYELSTEEIIAQLPENRLVRGLTFSGGEPFLQATALAEIGREAKQRGFSIVTFTGFVCEHLLEQSRENIGIAALLSVTDLLIDGPFQQDQRDIGLRFRGSGNQRLIDAQATIKAGQPVEWTDTT
jgi:anaerobic ribonucleoside-triphosphate reductase activating protein